MSNHQVFRSAEVVPIVEALFPFPFPTPPLPPRPLTFAPWFPADIFEMPECTVGGIGGAAPDLGAPGPVLTVGREPS